VAVDATISGCRLRLCGGDELLDLIVEHARSRSRLTVLSGNVHAMNLGADLPWFRDALEQADVVRMDGAGLAFAARLLGHEPPSRATWADFGWDLAERCAEEDLSLYLLGAREGVAEGAAAALAKAHPTLRIAGCRHGYFDHSRNSDESHAVIAEVNASEAEVLVVAFGMPRQERWLRDHAGSIRTPVLMTAGGALDYLSGHQRRGPRWMTNHGLEWLARMALDPGRLWKRYIVGNPRFLWSLVVQSIRKRRMQ
jgi:N-acetylglucosaminyldiphosphoundecaprenol N-acetyl-beta-D-mannosaminyltransferase